MGKVQVVLDIISPEYIKEQSSKLDAWLWDFRDDVEEAEDAIDELHYYDHGEKAKDHNVSDWGSSFAKMKHKVVKSVKHVSILDESMKLWRV
uniref:Rx N-terminal domain-containing protein n=1 Tax=Arundo donax TaxID=35708 RepID=A0A0A9AQ81_ARUDO